ncbi:cysteine synthase A [Defluviimonas salinarum]|nr:cysteine synthase A [Defluviimonas salinarum]
MTHQMQTTLAATPAIEARGRVYGSITETVGNTPLVRINRMAQERGAGARVLAKLEFLNPLGSVKDRIGVAMLDALEARGEIGPGSTIVEPTSGNTGIALAFACAARGYRCILTMPDSFSVERRKLMRFLGAELVLTPKEKGINAAIEKAREIVSATPGAVMPWQFGNPANPEIHARTTAEEIWRDTNGEVDAIVLGTGTGGTLTGVARVLKAKKPGLRVIAVEPENSPVISGGAHAPHMIQGIGPGFIPENLDVTLVDAVETVSNDDAFAATRDMAVKEGIAAGISSGAALQVALRVAAREGMAGKTVVTIFASAAERYQSTVLFEGFGAD